MSEDRFKILEGQLSRTRLLTTWAFTIALIALIALTWVVIAFVVNGSQANSIRDLQRRVGQLEQGR